MSDGSTGLGEHEAWYLGDVAHRLRRVPAAQRAPMLAVLEDNLAERPPSASRPELLEALGAPADYAGRLRDAGGFRQRPERSRRVRLATGVLLLAGLVGAVVGWRWWTDEVEIGNYCRGVRTDPEVTVEEREAAGAHESLLSYEDGAGVSVGFCLIPRERVKIVEVAVAVPEGSLFRPIGVRMVDQAEPDAEVVPFAPLMLESHGSIGFYLDGVLANCEDFSAGTGMGFDELTVTYHHHGRTRTTVVDLGTQYTFVSPPDAECPRPRDSGD